MKPLFNSLGSHYSLATAISALSQLISANSSAPDTLITKLVAEFGGDAYLFFKGRDAIEFALRSLKLKPDDLLMTQAFACQAIEDGVMRAGAQPLYVDLAPDSTNLSPETLQAAYDAVPHPELIKAVLIQHSLGMPADTVAIRAWCNQKKLTLIEDLAQAFGGTDSAGQKLGSSADIVICSFGRDKIIDALSGGACVIRVANVRKAAAELYANVATTTPPKQIVIRDLVYPIWTWMIRRTLRWGLGSVLFYFGKALGILKSPTQSPTQQMTGLPAAYAQLALESWAKLDAQLYHRRQLAQLYEEGLTSRQELKKLLAQDKIGQSTVLRYPIAIAKPDELGLALAAEGIHLTDRWYRSAVDSGRLALQSVYAAGSCPNAESLSLRIFNLPTHLEITKPDAQRIVAAIERHS